MDLRVVKAGKRLYWPRPVVELVPVPPDHVGAPAAYFDRIERLAVRGVEGYVVDFDMPAERVLCKGQERVFWRSEEIKPRKRPTKANPIEYGPALAFLATLEPLQSKPTGKSPASQTSAPKS